MAEKPYHRKWQGQSEGKKAPSETNKLHSNIRNETTLSSDKNLVNATTLVPAKENKEATTVMSPVDAVEKTVKETFNKTASTDISNEINDYLNFKSTTFIPDVHTTKSNKTSVAKPNDSVTKTLNNSVFDSSNIITEPTVLDVFETTQKSENSKSLFPNTTQAAAVNNTTVKPFQKPSTIPRTTQSTDDETTDNIPVSENFISKSTKILQYFENNPTTSQTSTTKSSITTTGKLGPKEFETSETSFSTISPLSTSTEQTTSTMKRYVTMANTTLLNQADLRTQTPIANTVSDLNIILTTLIPDVNTTKSNKISVALLTTTGNTETLVNTTETTTHSSRTTPRLIIWNNFKTTESATETLNESVFGSSNMIPETTIIDHFVTTEIPENSQSVSPNTIQALVVNNATTETTVKPSQKSSTNPIITLSTDDETTENILVSENFTSKSTNIPQYFKNNTTVSQTSTTKSSTTTPGKIILKNFETSETTFSTISPVSNTTEQTTSTMKRYITTTNTTPQNQVHLTTKAPVAKKACDSAVCKKITSRMLNMMNHAVDPCEDFYEFTCGGQNNEELVKIANFELLFDYVSEQINNASPKYLQNFKDFYLNCVKHEINFNFPDRISLFDNIPDPPDNNLTDLFADLILTQSMPLFDVEINIRNDSQTYALEITLPGQSLLRTGISGWSIFDKIKQECLNEKLYPLENSNINLMDLHSLYRNCQNVKFVNAARNFVQSITKYSTNHIYSKDNLQHLLNLINNLQFFYPNYEEIYDGKSKFDIFTIGELNNVFHNLVDWSVLLGKITNNTYFKDDHKISVYFFKHIKETFNLLKSYNESDVINMLKLFSKLQLYENVIVPRERENREMYCMDLSKQLMPDIVSVIVYNIAQKDIGVHTQNMIIMDLFKRLKSNFNKSLIVSQLTEQSKKTLMEKLDSLVIQLILTGGNSSVTENYKSIDLSGVSYLTGVIELLKHRRTILYSLENTNATAASLLNYFVEHFDSHPKSFYPSKYMVFHPALFEKSLLAIPNFIRLTKIGLHLSREIVKHFDLIGRYYRTDSQVWQNEKYYDDLRKSSVHLLVDIYTKDGYNFAGKHLNFQINGSFPVNEMIVDNAAFRLLYNEFTTPNYLSQQSLPWLSDSYTIEKLFFISVAQEYCKKSTVVNFMEKIYETEHLPAPVRVQNIISNSKEFSRVFSCPEGSAMQLTDDSLIVQFPYANFSTDYTMEPTDYTGGDYSNYFTN